VTHEQFSQTLITSLPWWFEKVILAVGLLIAIIVTANMIPDTFEPGSLNLLLSKPISRWGLFLSKFSGGCVFIALCTAYLFFGLWIWLGVGLGVWDRAILLSIPLYVIVFAIYFSVSSVVGLVWRSAIVSVILTLLFWAFCFSIGWIFYWSDTKMDNSEFVHLFSANENVYPADITHQLKSWDEKNSQWENLIEANLGAEGEIQFRGNEFFFHFKQIPLFPGMSNYLAPLHDRANSRIISSRYELGRSATSGKKKILISDDTGRLRFKEAGTFPNDTVKIFKSENHGIIAVNTNGIFYQLNEELLQKKLAGAQFSKTSAEKEKEAKANKDKAKSKEESATTVDSTGENKSDSNETETETESSFDTSTNTDIEKPKPPALWKRVGPKRSVSLRSANDVGYSSDRDEFVVYRRGELNVYKLGETEVTDEETSPPTKEMVLSMNLHAKLPLAIGFDKGMSSRLSFGGNTIMVAFGNGKVITVDAESLTEKNEYQPEKRSAIETVTCTEDGRYFGALYRNGNLWLLDTQSDASMSKASVTGQGDVCGVAFSGAGTASKLWVTENTDRVAGYNLSDNSMIDRHIPPGGMVEKAYRYGIRPFYKICPKPSEFYKVVTHLSSSGDTEANEDVDMNKTSQSSDPWSPLWSGLIFMFGMLFLGCVIFHFKDY
jgi:ABC-type transport system involved in multi-copper enzyme maturation permease subunit